MESASLSSIQVLLLILTAFAVSQGCGFKKDEGAIVIKSSSIKRVASAGGDAKGAYRAVRDLLSSTVRCDQCHSSSGSRSGNPFADTNLDTAYNAALANSLGNGSDPTQARVMVYTSNNHCGSGVICGITDVSKLSSIQDAVAAWMEVESSNASIDNGSGLDAEGMGLGHYASAEVIIPGVNTNLNSGGATQVSFRLDQFDARFGNSRVNVGMYCLVKKKVNGLWVCMYSIGQPSLTTANATGAPTSLTVAGLDFTIDGQFDSLSRPFSDPSFSSATDSNGGGSQNFSSSGGILLWGTSATARIRVYIKEITIQ